MYCQFYAATYLFFYQCNIHTPIIASIIFLKKFNYQDFNTSKIECTNIKIKI